MWVRSFGFDFVGTIDMNTMMQTPDGVAWVQTSANPLKQLTYMKRLLATYGPEMMAPNIERAPQSDLIVSAFVSEPFVQAISEKFGIPQINAPVLPYRPTASGAASLTPIFPQRTSRLNYWVGLLSEYLIWDVAREQTNLLRSKLGLPPHSYRSYTTIARTMPTLYGFSRHVVPPPPDWGDTVTVTGYWFLEEPPYQPPAALADFLAKGAPPVYLGFGSMADNRTNELYRMVKAALQQAGQRGILAQGWSQGAGYASDETLLVVDSVSHTWLFPQVAAVVHHGGAGTTAAGLRAGVPTMVIPHMSDQPFWGRRVKELGVGVAPVPRHALTAEKLAAGISEMVQNRWMRERVQALGEQVRGEDGIEMAVTLF